MLRQRVLTALVVAALFLGALFGLKPPWFALAICGVILLAIREWADLAGAGRGLGLGYVALVAVLLGGLFYGLGFASGLIDLLGLRQLLLAGCIWWAVALLWVQGYPSSAVLWGSTPVRLLMGLFVLLPAWSALSWLVTLESGLWLVLIVILTVVSADIGAFFAGRALGRHKLAVQVSPGKTFEGCVGGLLLALAVVSLTITLSPFSYQLGWQWLLIALATVVTSILGDLLESMVKRHRGVKDSGTILPGHGGILDRIDSLTAALPTFALLYLLLLYPRA